jgi:ribosomal protein L7/L12
MIAFDRIKSAFIDVDLGEGEDARLLLDLSDGIFLINSSGSMAQREKVRDAINRALGAEAMARERPDETAVRVQIARGAKVHAVALVQKLRGCSLAEAKAIVDDLVRRKNPKF